MSLGRYVLRYLVGIALWSLVFYSNYAAAEHSVLPIDEAFWLPDMVVPVGFLLIALGFLWVALTVKPNQALNDAQATVVMRMPWPIWAARLVSSLAVTISGFIAIVGPDRSDLMYSSPVWGIFWLVVGISLLTSIGLPRRRIEISPAGIFHSQVRPSLVAWADVAEVKLQRWGFSRYVRLKFRDGAEYRLAALPWRWRKARRLTVFPMMFGLDAGAVADALNMRRDVHAF